MAYNNIIKPRFQNNTHIVNNCEDLKPYMKNKHMITTSPQL